MREDAAFVIGPHVVPQAEDTSQRLAVVSVGGTELMKKYTWDFYAENVKKVYDELLEMQ